MSKDEDAAAKEWKEYHGAVKEMGLDDKGVNWPNIEYMYDGFFAGFYAGRDHERSKYTESEVDNAVFRAAHKVLYGKGRSKAVKMANGSALTQSIRNKNAKNTA